MAIPPVLLMVAALIGAGHGKSKSGIAGIIVQVLEDIGKALTVLSWVFPAVIGFCKKYLLKGAFSESPDKQRNRAVQGGSGYPRQWPVSFALAGSRGNQSPLLDNRLYARAPLLSCVNDFP